MFSAPQLFKVSDSDFTCFLFFDGSPIGGASPSLSNLITHLSRGLNIILGCDFIL